MKLAKWIVFGVICALFVGMTLAQDDIFTPSPELTAQMDTIERITSDVRGLAAKESVTRYFPTRDDIAAYLDKNLAGEENERLFAEAEHFYVTFDFMSPDVDLKTLYTALLGDQIAGYYDPETKEMNVVLISGGRPTTALPLLEQITYSHEFTHALQDQYFDLQTFLPEDLAETNPDASQARLSLVEGDATYVMGQYTAYVAEDDPLTMLGQLLVASLAAGSSTMPEDTPPILMRELLSPYNDGMNFIEALLREGGWDAVNAAYANPPKSTEHILHPDKYLAGDDPLEVTLAPDNSLGDGWTLVFERTLGEFYLREYLDIQLGALDVIKIGGGWGGDLYRLYYNTNADERAYVLKLAWDTPDDAQEFVDGFTQFGDKRFDVSADADGCWSNEVDALCFADVDGISLVSYAPDVELALGLLNAQRETVTP